MEAQLRTITKETLLILVGVLVAFYVLKLIPLRKGKFYIFDFFKHS